VTNRSGWWWQRDELGVGGRTYGHGVTVHANSSLVIELNRPAPGSGRRPGSTT
jgi:hypothetical protein